MRTGIDGVRSKLVAARRLERRLLVWAVGLLKSDLPMCKEMYIFVKLGSVSGHILTRPYCGSHCGSIDIAFSSFKKILQTVIYGAPNIVLGYV